MHIYIFLNHIMNGTTSLPLKTNSIYPVAVEDLSLHYQPSLSLYLILLMNFFVEYSRQICFYQMINYVVMIWWIETMIQCWEYEVEIQKLMKGHLCYTTRDNDEVKVHHAIVIMPVSN